MPGSIRNRSIVLVAVLALCGGCTTFGDPAPRSTGTPSTAASAESIAVDCDESNLLSCLEKTPAGESPMADSWAGDAATPAQSVVETYYAADYQAAKTTEYKVAGIQAAAHEAYESPDSGGPWASVTVARFADARGAATEAVGIDLDGLDVTDWSGKLISVPGLPGHAYPAGKADSDGYLRTDYAASVGNLLMIFELFSQHSVDRQDFAVWARGQYLSLESAKVPAGALAAGPAAALSCALPSCLIEPPVGDLPWTGGWGDATSVTKDMYVARMYSASRQPFITDELTAEGLTEAAHTTWIDDGLSHPGTVQADAILLRFSSDQGAQLHADRQIGNTGTNTFTVPGPGSAVGILPGKPDAEENYEVIVYGRIGAVEVEIHVIASQAPDRADAVSIAQRQLARLAADTAAAGS